MSAKSRLNMSRAAVASNSCATTCLTSGWVETVPIASRHFFGLLRRLALHRPCVELGLSHGPRPDRIVVAAWVAAFEKTPAPPSVSASLPQVFVCRRLFLERSDAGINDFRFRNLNLFPIHAEGNEFFRFFCLFLGLGGSGSAFSSSFCLPLRENFLRLRGLFWRFLGLFLGGYFSGLFVELREVSGLFLLLIRSFGNAAMAASRGFGNTSDTPTIVRVASVMITPGQWGGRSPQRLTALAMLFQP